MMSKGRRAFAASRLSAGLDANLATERGKQKRRKTAARKTGRGRRKGGRDKEERDTRETNPKRTLEKTAETAARSATGETEKTGKWLIAPNVI